MKQKLYMLVWDMDVFKGGINRVMLNRSAMLSDIYDVTLLTLDYKPHYKEIERSLSEMGRLHQDVQLLNIHDYYKEKFNQGDISSKQIEYVKSQTTLHEDGFQIQADEVKTKNYARYFKNGIYVKYKKWNKSGKLNHIDFFNENRCRTHRESFLSNGLLYKKTYYDLYLNKPVQDLFYTEDGNCFLNKWYNPNSGSIKRVFLIDPQNNAVRKFSNNREFNSFWLEELSLQATNKPIVICDGPGSTPVLLNLDSDLVYKICAVHSNHFVEPFTYGSSIKPNHVAILENIKDEDALVVLTESQKNHIIQQYGDFNNIHVIPHSIKPFTNEKIEKDNKLISIVARYHPEKRIDLAILAFAKVVEKVKDAKLEIYGEGVDRTRLEGIIKDNNLTENVFLKGFTNNVEEVFSRSLASLLTSRYEGFSLVLLESMLCRTPVISFDIPYGPNEIIVNEENGFLLKDTDIEAMANKIIMLLENKDLALKLGENGREHVLNNFSYKKHKENWLKLLSKFN